MLTRHPVSKVAGIIGVSDTAIKKHFIVANKTMPKHQCEIKHGTLNAYRLRKCRCDICVDYHNKTRKDYRVRKKKKTMDAGISASG